MRYFGLGLACLVVLWVTGCASRPPKIVVNQMPISSELGEFKPVEGEKATTKKYPLAGVVGESEGGSALRRTEFEPVGDAFSPPSSERRVLTPLPSETAPLFSRESFIAALRACVSPDSWSAVKDARAGWEGDHLVVTNLPSVVKKVETFIEGMKQERNNLIRVETTMVTGKAEDFEKWNAGFQPLASGGERVGNALVAICPTIEVMEWLAACKKNSRVSTIAAPRLIAFPMQRFEMLICSQKSFISAYQCQASQDGSVVTIDPVVGLSQEGVMFGERVVRVPGEQNFVLFLRLELTMPSHSYVFAKVVSALTKEHKLAPVEIPNVWKKEVAGRLLVPFDGTAVVLIPTAEPERLMAVIVTLEMAEKE